MGWNKTTRFFNSIWLSCDTVHNSKYKADKVKAEEVRMKAMERLSQTKKRASEEAKEGEDKLNEQEEKVEMPWGF